jgi:hypothetical protein
VKLYSNKITESDLRVAFLMARRADGADIWLAGVRTFRPRTADFRSGIQFYACSHNGRRPVNPGQPHWTTEDLPRAASWDAYGYVIARLFMIDRHAVIGPYHGVADFKRLVRQATYRREPKDFLSLLR